MKIPGTAEGVPAIRQMLSEGRSINVTLIFSLPRYADVIEAYISGLEAAAANGNDLSRISSVASFFISRVDTEVDRRLEAIGTDAALALRGKAAVAQGQLAYAMAMDAFSGDRAGRRWPPRALGRNVRCGRRRRPRTRRTPTPCTSTSSSARTPSTPSPTPRSEAFDDHGTVARTVDADPDGSHGRLGPARRRRHRHGRRRPTCSRARASRAFEKSFDELLGVLDTRAAEFRPA